MLILLVNNSIIFFAIFFMDSTVKQWNDDSLSIFD